MVPLAVVETDEFLATARKLMREDERIALVDYLAANPTAAISFKVQVGCGSCAGRLKDAGKVVVRG